MYIVNGKNYCRIDMNCVYVNWLEEARFTEPYFPFGGVSAFEFVIIMIRFNPSSVFAYVISTASNLPLVSKILTDF